MRRTAAYRFASDICFYYAIVSVIPAFLPLHRPMALFAAGSLAASLAAVYCPWAPLRFALALLPGLAFLGSRPGFLLIFPALAWPYLILVLTAGRFHVWTEGFRRSFQVMLQICLLAMISCILLNLIKPGFTLILPGMYYAMAFLCLGVFAMRRLQMNAEMSLRWNLANGAAAVGVPLLAVGVSLLLWRALLLLKPAAVSLLPAVKSAVAWLINTILPINPDAPLPTPTPKPTLTPEEEAITEPGWETPAPQIDLDWRLDPAAFEKAQRIGVLVLLALLAAGVAVLILYRARRNRAKAEQEEFFYEETQEGGVFRKRKKTAGNAAESSNARQIRNLYRKYLQLVRKQGVKIRRDSTSREILTEAQRLRDSPAAVRLRELYLTARYGDGSSVTFQDVQEAALCLQRILDDRA